MSRTKQFFYKILPGVCITCGSRSHRSIDLCLACEADLPWLSNACNRCGLPLQAVGEPCLLCYSKPLPFEQTIAAFTYAFPVDQLIQQFKNQRDLACGRVLATLLGQHIMRINPAFLADDDRSQRQTLLVPAPLHPKKQRSRGFNQARQVADILAAMFNIKVDDKRLIRTRFTADQKLLAVPERKKNVTGAFTVRQAFSGERIILVDDVVTTGATVAEMAGCLLRGGADSVAVAAVARTPAAHFSDNASSARDLPLC